MGRGETEGGREMEEREGGGEREGRGRGEGRERGRGKREEGRKYGGVGMHVCH